MSKKKTLRHYAVSSLVTFASGLALFLVSEVAAGKLGTVDQWTTAALLSLLLAAIRAGAKSLLDSWLSRKLGAPSVK